MPTPTTPTPLAQAQTYRGIARGWAPIGAPQPLAQAQALAALAARVRPDLSHRVTLAPAAPALPVAPTPGRRWPVRLAGDLADAGRGLALIAAAYGLTVGSLAALGLATGARPWATPTAATPAALEATLAR